MTQHMEIVGAKILTSEGAHLPSYEGKNESWELLLNP